MPKKKMFLFVMTHCQCLPRSGDFTSFCGAKFFCEFQMKKMIVWLLGHKILCEFLTKKKSTSLSEILVSMDLKFFFLI